MEGRLEGKCERSGRLGVVEGELAVIAAHNCSSCLGILRDTAWSGPRSH